MKKGAVKAIAIILALAMVLMTAGLAVYAPAYAADSMTDKEYENNVGLISEYLRFVHDNYKDEVSYETLFNGAYKGILDALDDRYSVFYATPEEQKAFTDSVNNKFGGVGIQIEVQSDGKCHIVQVIPNTPSESAGILAGDIITAVDGKSVSGLLVGEVSNLLRGDEGTAVNVTVLRNSTEKTFRLVRAMISVNSIGFSILDGGIGYIQITGFDDDTHVEFASATAALKSAGMTSLIIDLRGNPGGYFDMAIDIADQILPSGVITYVRQQGQIMSTYYAEGNRSLEMPVVLLVDGNSASASELLAAALKENGAAKVVGTQTFGKGIAQQIAEIDSSRSFKLSTFYFLSPKKNVIQGTGVTPDYVVKNVVASLDTEKTAALYNGFAPMPEQVKPTFGTVGLNVYGAQQRLALLGYDVTANGIMDERTVAAVRKFQKESGLWPYAVLDYTTMSTLDLAAYKYAYGVSSEDLQLEKAVSLLKK